MFNFFRNFLFLFKKPQFILIVGQGRFLAFSFFSKIIDFIPQKKKIVFLMSDLKDKKELKNLNFYLRRSGKPILVVTHLADISPFRVKQYLASDKPFSKRLVKIKSLVRALPSSGLLILNTDDETVKEIGKEAKANILTYGLSKEADLLASDLNSDIEGINFKVNFKDNTVPFWLKGMFGREYVYGVLAVATLAKINNLNLVDFSQILSGYKPLSGKMELIKGKDNILIINNINSFSFFSVIESLNILQEVGEKRRKVVIIGVTNENGKYFRQTQETIGEEVAKSADVIITIGLKAKFISKKAIIRLGKEDLVFHFDDLIEAKGSLKDIIKKNDLVLVNGSREVNMEEIIQKIKSIF